MAVTEIFPSGDRLPDNVVPLRPAAKGFQLPVRPPTEAEMAWLRSIERTAESSAKARLTLVGERAIGLAPPPEASQILDGLYYPWEA